MLCKSSSVCSASLFRRVLSLPPPVLCILLSSASVPRRAAPFLSVQSSAVVTSFVREEANVIYEQSRRRRHPSRCPRRRRRRRRVVDGRDAASVGFRLQFPLFQSNSYFPRGLLACDDNGSRVRRGKGMNRRIERANGRGRKRRDCRAISFFFPLHARRFALSKRYDVPTDFLALSFSLNCGAGKGREKSCFFKSCETSACPGVSDELET